MSSEAQENHLHQRRKEPNIRRDLGKEINVNFWGEID